MFNKINNILFFSMLYATDEHTGAGSNPEPGKPTEGKPNSGGKPIAGSPAAGNPNAKCGKGKGNKSGKGNHPKGEGDGAYGKRRNGNALAWHNKIAALYQLATHISQFKLAGKQVKPTAQPEALTLGNRISVFEMAITPGTVTGTEDPFNKAIIDLFNLIRGKYTSSIPFQANDLGTVIIAVANVIALIGCCDRVLDHLGYVSYKSALTPEILHASLVGDVNNATIKAGYDKDVFQAPNLKLALEIQIRRLQGLFMPKMSLFDFAGWIFRHVYFEDPTGLRGDMTLFRPSFIAKWSASVPVTGATGVYASGLEYRDINTYLVSPDPHSASIFLAAIQDCIDVLVQDDNVRTICGWLHQYMPDSPTIADLVQATRESAPEQNAEMDLFVAGLTVVPSSNFSGQYVQQDVTKECLYFTMTQSLAAAVDTWMINYHKVPTDDEVGLSLVFTALTYGAYAYSDPYVCTNQAIYRRNSSNGNMVVTQTDRYFNASSVNIATVLATHEGMNPTSLFYTLNSGGAIATATLVADCEYQVPVTAQNAYNVHYASISSLLTVEGSKAPAR